MDASRPNSSGPKSSLRVLARFRGQVLQEDGERDQNIRMND